MSQVIFCMVEQDHRIALLEGAIHSRIRDWCPLELCSTHQECLLAMKGHRRVRQGGQAVSPCSRPTVPGTRTYSRTFPSTLGSPLVGRAQASPFRSQILFEIRQLFPQPEETFPLRAAG